MSDAYQVEGVTITPMGGGVYELSHSSLAEPTKVRGKETAEDQARQIAAAAVPDEGRMEPQGNIDMAAQLAEANARAAAAEAELAKVHTVEPAAAPSPMVSGSVPRRFETVMEAEQRKALERAGIKVTRIILEENPEIPPTGQFLGHNGVGYVIVPGEPVDVPDFLLGVLDDAVMSAPVIDSRTQRVLGYRERMRYPYRRVD